VQDFNHNDFCHRYSLRQLPRNCRTALDVGCGTGAFARKLAHRGIAITAIDRASGVLPDDPAVDLHEVDFRQADFLTADLGRRYDFVSCIASLHHMPFEQAVLKLKDHLEPGGVLAVLGLARVETAADVAISLAAVPVNAAVRSGMRMISRGSLMRGVAPVMPYSMTLGEIRAESARLLPGARIRRHLFWRYSLVHQA
jgi:2-polyprenyl-3-methyl-5-hydroxy-6-metoxy-1,4-benzoquinol methylase